MRGSDGVFKARLVFSGERHGDVQKFGHQKPDLETVVDRSRTIYNVGTGGKT